MHAALIAGSALVVAAAAHRDALPDARMAGAWEGDAQIYVNWTAARRLPVRLVIAPDGTVTGNIGDARLVDATLRRNRGWLGRLFDVRTDYIVRGSLDGPVIAAEGVRRSGVSLPLNWSGTAFRGSVHTSGMKFGGADRMILTAGGLVLRHAASVSGAP